MSEKKHIAKAAGLMSIATFISRILGYARDMVFAYFFGATGQSDTFFIAFRIPNLLRELFAEGSMSAALIPVLTEYHTKEGQTEARKLVRVTFTFILAVVGLITILGIIFAPAVVTVIAPGFVQTPEKFDVTVRLTRIMFPFLLFISLAALTMGALNTKKVFFIPAFAPAMLNVTVITTIVVFYRYFEDPITAVAIGVVLGGLVQFAMQVPSFFKQEYDMRIDYNFRHPGLKKIAILILPATLGMAISQINIFISSIIASFLPGGSITYLFYSMHLILFPVGVFGVAMGTAVIPTLSGHALKKDFESLRDDFSFALRLLFFITVPAMAGLIALKVPIVSTLFQRGQFDYSATICTAEALLFYSLGIWSMVGVRIVTATFYSMQNTKTPVKVASIALITNIILSLALVTPLSYKGLALANALASMINFSLLFYFLRKKLQRIGARRIIKSFIKTSFASALMGVAGWFLLHGEIWRQSGRSIEKAGYLSGTIIICAALYFFISYLLKNEEMGYVINMIKKKIKGGN